MKNTTTLLFFLLLAFSCTKKEVQKEKQEVLDSILKDTIVQIDVSLYQENSLTKYRLGAFETYKEAREFRLKVSNEYKGAFVQALKNNVPISITEALQQ